MWSPLSSFLWHKDFPASQDIPRMGNGAGPPPCWLCSAASESLQAPTFPITALKLHKVFLIPPQRCQSYRCCRGTFFCTGMSLLFTRKPDNPVTLQHKPSLAVEGNNRVLDSWELLCKGEKPLLNPLLCPLTIGVCGCFIYIE